MEIRQIIKEMLASGMPEPEVLANLTDLGVPDAQKIITEVKATMQKPVPRVGATPAQAPRQAQAPYPAARKPEPAQDEVSESLFDTGPTARKPVGLFDKPADVPAQAEEPEQQYSSTAKDGLFDGDPMPVQNSGFLGSDEPSDRKIDELIALTKSLLDLNKKILESNRELLLRMAK